MKTPSTPRRYAVATLAAVATLGVAAAAGFLGTAYADEPPLASEETQLGELYASQEDCLAVLDAYRPGTRIVHDGQVRTIRTSRCLEYGEEGIQSGLRVTFT